MTTRDEDPSEEKPKRRRWLQILGALVLGGALMLAGVKYWPQKWPALRRDRYEFQQIGGGAAVARLDKATGEIVVVAISGEEISRYPSPGQKP